MTQQAIEYVSVCKLIGLFLSGSHNESVSMLATIHFHYFSNLLGRTGTFCILFTILDRFKVEQVVDVLQTVKLLRIKRPGIVEDLVSSNNFIVNTPYNNLLCRISISSSTAQFCVTFSYLIPTTTSKFSRSSIY